MTDGTLDAIEAFHRHILAVGYSGPAGIVQHMESSVPALLAEVRELQAAVRSWQESDHYRATH